MKLQSSVDSEQHPLVRLKNKLAESGCSNDVLLSLQRILDSSTRAEPVEGIFCLHLYLLFICLNISCNLTNIAVVQDLSDLCLTSRHLATKKIILNCLTTGSLTALAIPEDLETYEWPENVAVVQQVDSRQITNHHVKDLLNS